VLSLQAERDDGTRRRVLARHVVLGTGMDGNGAWTVPAMVRERLPRDRYAHTAEPIDFTGLAGKRVAVLGAGASAFDNAATALEHGAARVDLLARRESLPRVNPNRWIEFHGFLSHFAELPDALRWRYMRTLFAMSQPPPQETWDRCAAHPQFAVHLGTPITRLGMAEDGVVIGTPRGDFVVDFLILGTGLTIDLALRPELSAIAPHAALWRDRYVPPPGEASETIGGFPYLGPDLSFTERTPGAAPWITRVRSCSFGSLVSTISSAGISMLRPTVERIARGIARDLFLEQAGADHALLTAYDERELVSTALASDAIRSPCP
jgi:cation diffusion facilitator CzcD-associated flavoprotein CzcO